MVIPTPPTVAPTLAVSSTPVARMTAVPAGLLTPAQAFRRNPNVMSVVQKKPRQIPRDAARRSTRSASYRRNDPR